EIALSGDVEERYDSSACRHVHARGCGASARKTKNGRGRGTIVADLHPRSPPVLLESNADRNAGNELYQVTYNSWADVLSNTIAAQGFLPLDLNPLFSNADLTFDVTAYRLLLESDADRNASNELYQVTYNSWA